MTNAIIDLRSDTVTRPSSGMRKAIFNAEVGDDVYGEDPTVNQLEQYVASKLGFDAGLFVPSGTMGNQIAIKVHTQPGQEVIIERYGHSFAYETGGMAALAGVQAKLVDGERGIMRASQIEAAINPADSHYAKTSLIVVENSANRGGGTIYSIDCLREIAELATRANLALHMDGARIWNAALASQTPLETYGSLVNSTSVCLSKGLGAPVGSVLLGNQDFIQQARRVRKMYGGGMRQAGLLAAAAMYAFEHNLSRIEQDHMHLQQLARGLSDISGLSCHPENHPTNIAYARVHNGESAPEMSQKLKEVGVLAHAMGPKDLRFVTHLDVDSQDIDEALKRVKDVFESKS